MSETKNFNNKKAWTEFDEDFIRNNWTDMTDQEIGEILGRSYRSIRTKRNRMGLFMYFQEGCEPIKNEKWVAIDDKYEASNKGRIRRDGNKILRCHVHKTGYVIVSVNAKNQYLHKVIWEAFNGEIEEGFELDHKDCNKLNNSLNNLEKVTHQENMRRAYHNGCFKNFFGREPLTTIPDGSTPK
jgi:hypothetical protein